MLAWMSYSNTSPMPPSPRVVRLIFDKSLIFGTRRTSGRSGRTVMDPSLWTSGNCEGIIAFEDEIVEARAIGRAGGWQFDFGFGSGFWVLHSCQKATPNAKRRPHFFLGRTATSLAIINLVSTHNLPNMVPVPYRIYRYGTVYTGKYY